MTADQIRILRAAVMSLLDAKDLASSDGKRVHIGPIDWIWRSDLEHALAALPDPELAAVRAEAPRFEKNGITKGERVVCVDAPSVFGTVIACAEDRVKVRWDDGGIGDLVWSDGVAYNAYRLQTVRGLAEAPPPQTWQPPTDRT